MWELWKLHDDERLRRGQGLWLEDLCRDPIADEMLALRRQGGSPDDPFAAGAARMRDAVKFSGLAIVAGAYHRRRPLPRE